MLKKVDRKGNCRQKLQNLLDYNLQPMSPVERKEHSLKKIEIEMLKESMHSKRGSQAPSSPNHY